MNEDDITNPSFNDGDRLYVPKDECMPVIRYVYKSPITLSDCISKDYPNECEYKRGTLHVMLLYPDYIHYENLKDKTV